MPLLPLREMSMTAMSGWSVPTKSKARGPSSASPHTVMSASASMSRRSPARRMGWSSTSRTLILGLRLTAGVGLASAAWALASRWCFSVFIVCRIESAAHDGAAGFTQGDVQRAADLLGAVGHDSQAQTVALNALRGQSHAVVHNAQRQLVARALQAHDDAAGPAVLDGVVHRFLRQPEQVRGDVIVRDGHTVLALDRAGDIVELFDCSGQIGERWSEAIGLDFHRKKPAGQVARLSQRLDDQLADLGCFDRFRVILGRSEEHTSEL